MLAEDGNRKTNNQHPMLLKTKNSPVRCPLPGYLLVAFSMLCVGYAQTPVKPAADQSENKDEELYVLSPFTVDATRDVGYRANNTLAGTRINTNLRDVAAPVSVVTKDFMNDISATNVNDILAFQTGSEGTRDFSATTPTLGRTTDEAASSPNTAIRGRGLSSYDLTRDYFYTIGSAIGFDPYNLESVTISRGPNSILAGLGSPSGIISYSPQTASLTKNSNEVSYRYGSFNDHRATLNTNHVLVRDVLAFRFATVAANEGFKQEPAYAHNRRAFLATTVKPFQKTTVKVSYEWVNTKDRRPNTLTPEDDVSAWLASGKPSYTEGQPFSVIGDTYPKGPSVFYNSNGSLYRAIDTTNQKAFYQGNTGNVGLWQAVRFHDNTYGNWDELNTNASTSANTMKTWNITVDQEIVKNLYLNLAFVREDLTTRNISLYRPDYVTYQVDVNRTLPGGATNPHYGETYMAARGLDNLQKSLGSNEAGRASLTYSLDLRDHNKWLGRYNAVVFGEKRTTENNFMQFNSQTSSGAETGRYWYLGGTAANGYRPITTPQVPTLVTGAPYLDATGASGTFSDSYVLKSNTRDLTKLTTTAAVGQAYLLNDIVVLTGGIRRDVNDAASVIGAGQLAGEYPALTRASATTKTYGVVVHPIKWFDVFYNKSENFIPNAGAVDLSGKTVPSPKGTSKDWGFSVSTPDKKFNARVDWYETNSLNAYSPVASLVAQWSFAMLETGYPTTPTGGAFRDLARKQGIVYKDVIAPGIVTGDPRLTKAYTSDQQAKGIEVELTYNPTNNWRIFATITKQEAKETNVATNLTAMIKERLAYWQSTPGLWTGQTTTLGWDSRPLTGQEQFNTWVNPSYLAYQAEDGKPSTQIAKWHANLVTNYTFTEGFLKHFSAGTGLRYIEGAVIGNPAIYNSSGTVVGLDTQHPYKSSDRIAVDVWVGYRKKLTTAYTLDLQLRCQDAQSSGGYRAIAANSDGNHAVYSITQPRKFYLTAKLEF